MDRTERAIEGGEPQGVLADLESRFAGLDVLLQQLADYFKQDSTSFRGRIDQALQESPLEVWCSALEDWQSKDILPGLQIETDHQVASMWTSPFFQLVLDRGAEFTPPPGTDLSQFLRVPMIEDREALAAVLQRVTQDRLEGKCYWKTVFHLVFPEVYLEPYLKHRSSPLHGCDLASSWGRACLNLRHWDRYKVTALDLSESSLQVLRQQAICFGIEDRLSTVCADLREIPVRSGSFDFFLAFDIFEHLTDETLLAVISEVLRVARPGAVLYTEIPLHDYFPPITHLQDFSIHRVLEIFQSVRSEGKSFRPIFLLPEFPIQLTFRVDWADLSPPVVLPPSETAEQ